MGRRMVSVETLHGYSIKELIKIKKDYKDSYGSNILSIVIDRHEGVTTDELTKKYKKSKPTVIDYIHRWNASGFESLVDNRGGSEGTFTDEMLETIKNAIETETPADYGFDSPAWTIPMFASIIEKKFGKLYSCEWIRKVIKNNNYTYKKSKFRYSEFRTSELFGRDRQNARFCRNFY